MALQLTSEQALLWQRLTDFPFDAGPVAKPFAARLSLENGWTTEFASRVVDEYRRFLLLTAVAGHVVCPSEEVDAVWHQHLIYSRSYWNDLCRDTLGFPLHHDPTAGGAKEARKHWQMYRQTLDSYRRVFGEEPPRDIWPLPHDRFDRNSRSQVVNLRDVWLVPKPAWLPRFHFPWGIAAAILPVAAVGLGPLDWSGPSFLLLLAGLYVAVLFLALMVRHRFRDVSVRSDRDLTPEELACLSFGRPAAVNAVVAGMLRDKQLIVEQWPKSTWGASRHHIKLAPGSERPAKEQQFATLIYQTVDGDQKTLPEIQSALARETKDIESRLEDEGYLLSKGQAWLAAMLPAAAIFSLLAFAVCKLILGIQRNRPIEFLIVACLGLIITAVCLMFGTHRSLAGSKLLAALKSQHAHRMKPTEPGWTGSDIALGASLFGAAALHGQEFETYKQAWKSTATGGATGNGSGGCGGGGCGGGGCGGGCGGCSG